MSSSTVTPATSRAGYAERHGYGLIIIASVLLLVVGCFNLIDGIAVANSHGFIADAHYVFGDLRTWGWITLILGALQLLAAGGILAGNQFARWFAVAVVGLNAIAQMFFMPAYPFWSLMIIAVEVVALWWLCAYGSRQNLAAWRKWPSPRSGSSFRSPDLVAATESGGQRPPLTSRSFGHPARPTVTPGRLVRAKKGGRHGQRGVPATG